MAKHEYKMSLSNMGIARQVQYLDAQQKAVVDSRPAKPTLRQRIAFFFEDMRYGYKRGELIARLERN